MVNIIDGNLIAKTIKFKVLNQTLLNYPNAKPTLACIMVGDNPASAVYVKNKEKACADCGINSKIIKLPETSSFNEVKQIIENLNADKSISGILLQLPLPYHLQEFQEYLINTINPQKDVDCLTDLNLGKMFAGQHYIAPCTATGIMKILNSINYDLDGKDVVVIGRSLLVGKSVSMLLQEKNATVTNCHSHTTNLQEKCKKADVLIVAVGKPNFITKDFVKPGAVVIDVGINRTLNGLVGDVNFEEVKNVCSNITPVPGGVGPLTVASLMENTIILNEAFNSDLQPEHEYYINKP